MASGAMASSCQLLFGVRCKIYMHQCRVFTAQTNGIKKNVVVIKVGTSSLLRQDKNCIHLSQVRLRQPGSPVLLSALNPKSPTREQMTKLCEAVASLHDAGHSVVLVSSGAVGAGCQRLGAYSRRTMLAGVPMFGPSGPLHPRVPFVFRTTRGRTQ